VGRRLVRLLHCGEGQRVPGGDHHSLDCQHSCSNRGICTHAHSAAVDIRKNARHNESLEETTTV
jgi:hypothetical protein